MNQKYLSSHLSNAVQILSMYDGSTTFSSYIKNYFSKYKKFGSKDRKQITHLCYSYFRLGKSCINMPIKDRILLSLRFTENTPTEWRSIIDEASLPQTVPLNIFPWKNELSSGIDHAAFEASFSAQPDIFLRIRPGHEKTVLSKLHMANVAFEVERDCLRLTSPVKIDNYVCINKEVVVQDASSQQISRLLLEISQYYPSRQTINIYDCCAASGGKSILAYDVLPHIDLTVSDIRPGIMANLKKRFAQAGITKYKSFIKDILHSKATSPLYDVVIADVPCTGSGTWARTPEQLYFFIENKISEYAALQKNIINNILPLIRPGGFLLYITCSVFAKENEIQVQHILHSNFTLVEQKVIAGYGQKADTMFAALLKKK